MTKEQKRYIKSYEHLIASLEVNDELKRKSKTFALPNSEKNKLTEAFINLIEQLS